jgi:hypothetical protein
MLIGLLNTKGELLDALASMKDLQICDFDNQPFNLESCPDIMGLFIDWLPKELNEKHFIKQATVLQEYVKRGIPVVLFDRHTTISQQEYKWLSKYNVTFMEPRVRFRQGFEWCPQWTGPLPDDFWAGTKDKPRSIKLAYRGPLATQIKSFEKYYKTYATIYPGSTTVYKCTDLDGWKSNSQKDKLKEWQEHNLVPQNTLKNPFEFEDVDTTVLISSYKDYASGYLPDNLFSMMKSGVIPLLPIEHRFFGAMFDNLIVKNETDVHYAVETYPKVRGVIIEEIFDNIFNRYPEFKLDYMIERLMQCLTI